MKILQTFCCVTFVVAQTFGFQTEEGCVSPHFVEIGTSATIKCYFKDGYLGIFWYNSTDHVNEDSLLSLRNSVKSGTGYSSGEFDIHENGSLIINNVSLHHDHEFTVVKMIPGIILIPFNVRVIVIAKPILPFPIIQGCKGETELCFIAAQEESELLCSVRNTRPSITLSWFTRNVTYDENVTSTVTVANSGAFSSSFVTTKVKLFSPVLTLLYCKAIDPPPLLKRNESFILVENNNRNLSRVEAITKTVERGQDMQLICGDFNENETFLVWKRERRNSSTNLVYAAFMERNYTNLGSKDYHLGMSGALIHENTRIEHEGLYTCTFSNGVSEGVSKYNVIIYVNPVPAYPVVEGCNQEKFCTLEVTRQGKLTCTLQGIRPNVRLKWKSLLKTSSKQLISFFDEKTTIKNNGEIFDVSITTAYIATTMNATRLTVECIVVETTVPQFDFSAKVHLIFTHDDETTSQVSSTNWTFIATPSQLMWIIIAIVITILIFTALVAVGVVIFKVYRSKTKPKRRTEKEENVPMMSQYKSIKDTTEIKRIFIDQIKRKYRNQYEAVHPIPYIKDRLYCVNMVFVEVGIQCLSLEGSDRSQTWHSIESYRDIFNDPASDSERVILEGGPGYGKSTLSLQLVYDWCNLISECPLREVDIIIFLRLRQLGGVCSIYRAIKQFLLPKDSEILENDIKAILSSCSSVVVILDGFDEYPDQTDAIVSDIKDIIEGEMFQKSTVLLTTRSYCLPKKYAPHTKRMKLIGFDDRARDKYISKAVAGNDIKSAEEIKQQLKENPGLSDLCQVPLFFVMFAHMTHEKQDFRDCTSVTLFFRYMIASFHSHMRNKMEEDNVRQYRSFENNHKKMSKAAFSGLTKDNRQLIVWNKTSLQKNIGKCFYDQYVRIGILVEEEVICMNDDVGSPISEHVQCRTEVRFFHKLFCEWYAAHYLSNFLARPVLLGTDNLLSKLDPFILEYLYRFACGLNPTSAKKIIKYLQKTKDGDKFAILCIMEQIDNANEFLDIVRQLCLTGITLSKEDSGLLQRSIIQLLDIAFCNKIPISSLHLDRCFSAVNVSESNLIMTSNRKIAKLQNVTELSLYENGRVLTEKETTDIFAYAIQSLNVKTLIFRSYTLPECFSEGSALSMLQCHNTNVHWLSQSDLWYRLNLQSGLWEGFFDGTKKIKINQ